MASILVELIERNNLNSDKTSETYIIHVDETFSSEDTQRYVNLIKNNTEIYSFYINKILFKDSLSEVLKENEISTENKIVIEFELTKDKFDEEILFEYQISFIKIDNFTGKLYIGFYDDLLKVYENGKVTIFNDNELIKNLRCLAVNKLNIYGYKQDSGILNLNDMNITECKNILNIELIEDKLYLITKFEKFCKLKNTEIEDVMVLENSHPCALINYKNELHFVYVEGGMYKLSGILNNFDFLVTCVTSCSDFMVFGTSINAFYIVNGEVKKFNTEIRYLDSIRIINKNYLVISGQYKVQIVSIKNNRVIDEYIFNDEISGVEIFNEKLFISSVSKVYTKKLII